MQLADGKLGVICHFYDLTERVRFENELQDRERRLTLAYETAELGAWEVDLKSFETKWSPQVYRMFEATDETVRRGPHRPARLYRYLKVPKSSET